MLCHNCGAIDLAGSGTPHFRCLCAEAGSSFPFASTVVHPRPRVNQPLHSLSCGNTFRKDTAIILPIWLKVEPSRESARPPLPATIGCWAPPASSNTKRLGDPRALWSLSYPVIRRHASSAGAAQATSTTGQTCLQIFPLQYRAENQKDGDPFMRQHLRGPWTDRGVHFEGIRRMRSCIEWWAKSTRKQTESAWM